MTLRSIELFAGIGGLAMGMSRAGFKHSLLVEWDRDAHSAVMHNKDRGVEHVRDWPATIADVRDLKWSAYRGKIDVITGGPPCQPFGIGGKKRGHEDERDMWPEAVRAIAEASPVAFVYENVRNLSGPRFEGYLTWVKARLAHPNHPRRKGESHADHLLRLQRLKEPPIYLVDHLVENAADHGAAQIRYRVLVRGVLASTGLSLSALQRTHSRDALLWQKWVTGEYWDKHSIPRPNDDRIPRQDRARVEYLRAAKLAGPPQEQPWVTVRDAIYGLGEPNGQKNHVLQPGARAYKGHTGSPLDLPAKALKAGDHGVPGGENMMVRDDGGVRYFTAREAARLVGLPDDYLFPASWSETMRGLGNAVPAALGEAVGRWLARTVTAADDAGGSRRRQVA